MIFYAATLKWQGLQVSYTSWLHHHPAEGTRLLSRLRHVQMPVREGSLISWADPGFGVSGTWTSRSPMVEDRIFDSEEGYLDWHCYQPASDVRLTVNGKSLEGRGYAEQLIMTVPTWKIPMDELRWGRFGSDEDTLIWIELREKEKKQWLWHNGEKIADAVIEDDHIVIPERKLVLDLDRSVILESEKKILSVVERS